MRVSVIGVWAIVSIGTASGCAKAEDYEVEGADAGVEGGAPRPGSGGAAAGSGGAAWLPPTGGTTSVAGAPPAAGGASTAACVPTACAACLFATPCCKPDGKCGCSAFGLPCG